MLLGAAIFPESSKYGGGPEKMAIVVDRQRWRRCSGAREIVGFGRLAGREFAPRLRLTDAGVKCELNMCEFLNTVLVSW